MSHRTLSSIDRFLVRADAILRQVTAGQHSPQRTSPASSHEEPALRDDERRHAAGLMRVNHTGEVCAQALYQGQALLAREAQTRNNLLDAAQEEIDHLAWCEERLSELDAKPSVLNPLFYGMSFAIGVATAAAGDRISLGFVHATEERVASHLREHLQKLPAEDRKSQLILQQMLADEQRHGEHALAQGGEEFSARAKDWMTRVSKLMTDTTYWI